MALDHIYGTGSITESAKYTTVDELLVQIPDNTQNLIKPSDLRDSVYTLWDRISEIGLSAGNILYTNQEPVPVAVGGISQGMTFSEYTMQQMWDALLYPYVAPMASLSISGSTNVEYGNPSYLGTDNITLNWSATKKSKPITSIIVNGRTQVLGQNGGSTSGTETGTATYSASPGVSTTNSYTMTVSDGDSTTSNSASLTWKNKIYWGTIDLTSIGDPNLTLDPSSAANVSSLVDSSAILSLNGAGVGSGNELSTSKSKVYNNIDGGGDYLIFAWPSNVSGATTPTFKVNGLTTTAFTSVRSGWSFTNQYGFITNYEVWVTNTPQNSPIDVLEII